MWKQLARVTWIFQDNNKIQAQVIQLERLGSTHKAMLGNQCIGYFENPELAKAILETQYNLQKFKLA